MKIPIPITTASLMLAAAAALAGCTPDHTHESRAATPSSSTACRVGDSCAGGYGNGNGDDTPVADHAFVNGKCAGIITVHGDTWALPDGGAGALTWAPNAVANGCDGVAVPGQTAAATTTSTGAGMDIPDSEPQADYAWVDDRCAQLISLATGTVWAMPGHGVGPLTQVSQDSVSTGGCKIMPSPSQGGTR